MNFTHLLFSFEGRIRRLHYWLASIGLAIVEYIVYLVAIAMFGGGAMAVNPANPMAAMTALMPIYLVVTLIFLWPGLALGVKRCHDRDKTGWFLLIAFIPLIGWLWLFIELGFIDGTQGPNKYGPSPKGVGGAALAA